MSEEEKEATEYIKAFQKDLYGASEKNLMAIYIDRVWNYIDKLQKELEQEKEKNKLLKIEVENFDEASDLFIKDNCVYKQDIRNKIKELEQELEYEITKNEARLQIEVLKELLEEEKLC